jgi:hypothetical protein
VFIVAREAIPVQPQLFRQHMIRAFNEDAEQRMVMMTCALPPRTRDDHCTVTRRTPFRQRDRCLDDNVPVDQHGLRDDDMPVIARGRGFVAEVYYFDHAPPHIHIRAGGQRVVLAVTAESGASIAAGAFADRATERRVVRWAQHRAAELEQAWRDTSDGLPPQAVMFP